LLHLPTSASCQVACTQAKPSRAGNSNPAMRPIPRRRFWLYIQRTVLLLQLLLLSPSMATSVDVIRGVSAELLKSCSMVLPHSLPGLAWLQGSVGKFPLYVVTISLADSTSQINKYIHIPSYCSSKLLYMQLYLFHPQATNPHNLRLEVQGLQRFPLDCKIRLQRKFIGSAKALGPTRLLLARGQHAPSSLLLFA
jgi:hypothetical protein